MRNDFQEGAFLAHSAKGTTWKKGTGYLKKIPLGNGKFYYIYNQAQLDAYNRKASGQARNVLSNKVKQEGVKNFIKINSLDSIKKSGFAVKGKTTAEKTKNLNNSIEKGNEKITEMLEKSKAQEKESKKSGGSSKGGSSGSKKSGGSSKGSSSGSKKSGSGSSKEKAAAKKSTAEKVTKETKKKEQNNAPINLASLKKIYGIKDEEVTKHDMTSAEFKNEMLSKYKEGSFGYLMAGGKAYKWTIDGGQLVLKDFNTDKDVSFDTYLKDVKSFEEFQTNKKKKK